MIHQERPDRFQHELTNHPTIFLPAWLAKPAERKVRAKRSSLRRHANRFESFLELPLKDLGLCGPS